MCRKKKCEKAAKNWVEQNNEWTNERKSTSAGRGRKTAERISFEPILVNQLLFRERKIKENDCMENDMSNRNSNSNGNSKWHTKNREANGTTMLWQSFWWWNRDRHTDNFRFFLIFFFSFFFFYFWWKIEAQNNKITHNNFLLIRRKRHFI